MTASSLSQPSADGGQLRPGRPGITRFSFVRIVLGVLAVVLPVALTMFLVHQLVEKSMRGLWPQLLAATLCVVGYRLYVQRIERRPMAELAGAGAGRELGAGLLLGSLLFAGVIATMAMLGGYRVDGASDWEVLMVPLTELVLVALFEETLFRGVLYRNLERSLGSWSALGISSLVFGLAHLPNANVTVAGIAVTVVAGLLFAAAYLVTRRLWLAIGIHFAWNFMSDAIFSVTTSGHPGKGILKGTTVGPEWLSGGAYGVEASLVTLVALGAVTAALLGLARRRGQLLTKAEAQARRN